jgi:hypothetical protein
MDVEAVSLAPPLAFDSIQAEARDSQIGNRNSLLVGETSCEFAA